MKRFFQIILLALLSCLVIGVVYTLLQRPSNDRTWSLDQALLPIAEITNDIATIRNIRNFTYRSTTDYTPAYYDRTFTLDTVERVDYIVEPFESIGAAHTFVSFGLTDGSQIAISVEIRKEMGETFSPWRGLARQYELMYVVADERDVIGLRAVQRGHPVYLFPTVATPEQAQALLLAMLERTNTLARTPEFYHTLRNNCTTNLVAHLNTLTSTPVRWDYRFVLPARSAEVLERHGWLAIRGSVSEVREQYRINQWVSEYLNEPDFSARIRSTQVNLMEDAEVETSVVSVTDIAKIERPVAVAAADLLHLVTRVIDGDTIEVEYFGERRRVRYIGIDTPETVHPSRPVECFGVEAAARNRSLVEGKLVRLERDITDVDKYDRLLRYVYVDDVFVNEQLVAEGFATAYTYPPDIKYTERLRAAEVQARNLEQGFWGSDCISEVTTRPINDAGEVCIIKGNISQTSGERIYHVPGCEYYNQTIISPAAGERWFCTESEAVAAGWRKALNCL